MSDFDDYLKNGPATPAASSAPDQSFDAYLGASSQPASNPAVPPALQAPQVSQAPQGWTAPNSFLMGVGDVVRGGANDIVHGLSWAADKVAPNSQFAKDARAALPQMQNTIDQQNAQYDAQNGGSGFDIGRLAGNVAGTAPLALMGGGGPTLLGKLGMGAFQGATGAALMPTTGDGGSFADQTLAKMGVGGGLGLAGPLVGAAAKAAGKGIANLAAPVFRPASFVGNGIANGMSPADAAAAAANIRSAPVYTPGYLPTTAQVAGSPYLVQTEKAAANLPTVKNALVQNGINNNQTVWNTLNNVAGTKLDLDNAIAARSTATNPLYNVAKQSSIPVDAPMTDLMNRPAMQNAITRAQTLANNTNAGPIFQTSRIPNSMGGSPTSLQTLTGNGAQAVKESLDAMLLPENTQRLSPKEISALQDTRSAYISWLEGHSPAFTQARQTYAAMSPPINTMQAGQAMVDRLGSLGRSMDASQTPIITAPGYATALTHALNGQEFGIEPAAQTTLENIGRDLQRSTVSNSIRNASGSDTGYNLNANGWLARNLYGPAFGGATPLGRGLAGLLAGGVTAMGGHPMLGATVGSGVAGGLGKIGQAVGSRIENRLSGLLTDPQTLLPYLDARAAAPQQAIQGPLINGLLNYGRPAATTGLISGFQNPGNK